MPGLDQGVSLLYFSRTRVRLFYTIINIIISPPLIFNPAFGLWKVWDCFLDNFL